MLRPLPLLPLKLALGRVATVIGLRHPSLFARLGSHSEKAFLVDPIDLPFVFLVRPSRDTPTAEPRRRGEAGQWDARIAGSLAALIGMVHGTYDGDALFFSRDIVIEGDTEAVVALRNALDDAELDLVAETVAALGPPGLPVESVARHVVPLLSRMTGFPLTRAEGYDGS